ncbi:MAG: M66 family metalloprotease [Promethearchaeota archaeon]
MIDMTIALPTPQTRDWSKIALSIFITVLVIANGFVVLAASTQGESATSFETPQMETSFDYEITVVFLGIDESRINATDIAERLPDWYAPIDGVFWRSTYDEEFSLSYNFVFADQEAVTDYRAFIYNNSNEDRSPLFIQPEHPTARYIHSSLVEKYLRSNVSSGSGPTLVIIDTYSQDPPAHMPYYYNCTYNELDAELDGWSSTPIPWASTYQIAGGGEDSRLLWLDLSAGPTEYHSYEDSTEGGVENIRPIWEYTSQEQLADDIVKYIAQAVECRFLPAIGYRAGYAYREVRLEVLLVDLANSELKFEEQLKLDYIASQYVRYLPFVEWTYSVVEWDYQSDAAALTLFEQIRDEESHTYDVFALRDYLDSRYAGLFNGSTSDRFIIPIFLFLLPDGWRFDPDWGGFSKEVNGEFAYIVGKQTPSAVNPDFVYQESIPLSDIEIENGSYFSFSGPIKDYLDLSVSLTAHTGNVSMYLLDEYGFDQFSKSLLYENLLQSQMMGITNTSGTATSEAKIKILGQYHFVVENTGLEDANVDLMADISGSLFIGYTWKIMHEVGHALGLNHPHDAYSYGNYDHPDAASGIYLNWLWDMSYSQISYANQAPEISIMDIDTLQREAIPEMWADGIDGINALLSSAPLWFGNVPDPIMQCLVNASSLYDQSVEYYRDCSDLDNYNQSIRAAYAMWQAIDEARSIFDTTRPALPFVVLIVGPAAVVILVAVGYYRLRHKRVT